MSAERFTWLHLTDLHVGLKDGEWLWPGVEEEVLLDLGRLHDRVGPLDAVFFTGDLTQCGDEKEFQRFDEVWGAIRTKLEYLGSATFVAVPGNHDLVRPERGSAVLDGLRHWNTDTELRRRFWIQDDGDYRQAIRRAFEPWSAWADRAIDWNHLEDVQRAGLLPGDFAATMTKGGRSIGVLGLNTAALQLAAGDYRGRLSVHARQAAALVGKIYEWVARHDACIVLTHHDSDWLDGDGQGAWNGEIAKPGRFAVHLCGHRHQQRHTVVRIGGAHPRTSVIGRSLFGLETYEHEGGRQERLHGYSVGAIEFGSTRTMRLWPRRDELQQAGHREIRADQSVTLDGDEGTHPEDLGPSPRPRPPVQAAIASRSSPPSGSPLEGWIEITREYLQAHRRDLNDAALRHFYDGQEPGWAHAQLGDDEIPRREVVGEAMARLRDPTTMTLVLLVSAGGEGKSLAIRQAAVDLVAAGHRVLWRQDDARLEPGAVTALPQGGSWILVSDDGEMIAREFAEALKMLHAAERQDVHWLIAARDTDWRARFPRRRGEPPWSRWAVVWPSADQNARRVVFGLSETDANKIVGAWKSAGALGRMADVPEANRAPALVDASRRSGGISNGTFFGSVLENRFGAVGLRDHLRTVMQRLAEDDLAFVSGYTLLDAFLYAAAAEAVGIDGVDLKVVAELVGVERQRRRPEILHRLGQEAAASGGGNALRTRAPAVARAAVQLLEVGQADGDLEEIYKSLVRVTGELGRNGEVDVSHGAIMNCGPRLARELPKLGIGRERVHHVACATADEASRVDPGLLVLRITQAKTYRDTDSPRRASDILRDALRTSDAFVDWESTGRGALYELAVCEGRVPNLIDGCWLAGLSLADGPRLGRVTTENANLALAGLGAACLEISKGGPLDEPLRKLLRAASVLGPRVTSDRDTKSASYFKRHRTEADRLKVSTCSELDALSWVAEAVRHAGEQVDDGVLHEIAANLVGGGPLSFEQLRRTLRLGTGRGGPSTNGGPAAGPAPGREETPRPTGHPHATGPSISTRTFGPPMTSVPTDLIAVLAEEYPDVREARAVWVRAGGTNGEVENVSRPRDLWQNQWLRSVRGATVRPAALLRAALEDLPNNGVIIRHLRTIADSEAVAAAVRIVDAIERSEVAPDRDGTLELLTEWEIVDEVDTFAAICPALEGRLPEERRTELRETLITLGEEVRVGTLTGLTKTGTSAAVKALLAALAAT